MTDYPTLYHKGSKGTIYSWKIWTEGADIVTEYGQVEGKKQIARKTAVSKNVGKSNETSPEDQARSEARSMWTFKVERKYRETMEDAEDEEIFLPMLAAKFEDRRGKKKEGHTYPCDVQPKLDGCRALAYWEGKEIKLMTRGGKYWDLPHVSTFLEDVLPPNMVLDGELYIHGASFQQITRLVKKARPETSGIKLHVYDCIFLDNRDAQWPERRAWLEQWDGFVEQTPITLLRTDTAKSEEDVLKLHARYIRKNYEGAIVRCYDDSAYRFAYRSKRLMKVKEFDDNEFEIVGYKTGVGKFSDCVIWKCVTADGGEFDATPRGTMEERRQWLVEADEHVGKWLRVIFQGHTEDGLPRFPVGDGFRLPEDM